MGKIMVHQLVPRRAAATPDVKSRGARAVATAGVEDATAGSRAQPPMPGGGCFAPEKQSLGQWDGVIIRCLHNLFVSSVLRGVVLAHVSHLACRWGVTMFLRIGWLVGWAGTWVALAITTLCLVVATLSALSMSAICTNGDTNGFSGGPYHLISRAAGPEYGHSCWHVVVFAHS